MGNPIDAMGCCIVCGKRCESTGGCDCSEVESYNHVPLKRVWKRTLVDADELAALRARVAELAAAADGEIEALQARLAEAEAQRAVSVAVIEYALDQHDRNEELHSDSLDQMRQALANQPPSDLVALVKAASRFFPAEHALDVWCAENPGEPIPSELSAPVNAAHAAAHDALDTLLTNQPGFRALIESEEE